MTGGEKNTAVRWCGEVHVNLNWRSPTKLGVERSSKVLDLTLWTEHSLFSTSGLHWLKTPVFVSGGSLK